MSGVSPLARARTRKRLPLLVRVLAGGLKVVFAVVAAALLLAGTAWVHTKLWPLSLETAARDAIYRRFIVRPPVVEAWGELLTRVEPVDRDHLFLGASTVLLSLRRSEAGYEVCHAQPSLGIVHEMALRGTMLYVAAGFENLVWYDVSDPCAPRRLGHFAFGGYGFGLFVGDHRLELANRYGGMAIFDLDEDGRPSFSRMRLGEVHADEAASAWMTNDLAAVGPWRVAADGKKGLLVFDADGATDALRDAVPPPPRGAIGKPPSIDPPPVSLQTRGSTVYTAMREEGIGVYRVDDDGRAETYGYFRPDDGEVVDLLMEGNRLFAATTLGNVFVYDLAVAPQILNTPIAVHRVGRPAILHSLGYDDGRLFATGSGTGLFWFEEGRVEPVGAWRPADDYREVARVGPWLVAALGSGGVAVYSRDGDRWREAHRAPLPSYGFSVAALDDERFAVGADQAGVLVFSIGLSGEPVLRNTFPTPEHVFSVDRCGQTIIAAEGVYGLMRYDSREAGGNPLEFKDQHELSGYSMRAACWNGLAIGTDFSSAVSVLPKPLPGALPSVPSRCFAVRASEDRTRVAIACDGDTVRVWTAGVDGRAPTEHVFQAGADVTSFLFQGERLFVGVDSGRLLLYELRSTGPVMIEALTLPATARQMIEEDGKVLVAAGKSGLLAVEYVDGGWIVRRDVVILPDGGDSPASGP